MPYRPHKCLTEPHAILASQMLKQLIPRSKAAQFIHKWVAYSCSDRLFAHQFAHQSAFYNIHPSKPHLTVLIFAHQFAKMCLISLTNSLTNSCSYHIRSQISHLTVLKFAHQFANILNCSLDCTSNINMPNRRLATNLNLYLAKLDPN